MNPTKQIMRQLEETYAHDLDFIKPLLEQAYQAGLEEGSRIALSEIRTAKMAAIELKQSLNSLNVRAARENIGFQFLGSPIRYFTKADLVKLEQKGKPGPKKK